MNALETIVTTLLGTAAVTVVGGYALAAAEVFATGSLDRPTWMEGAAIRLALLGLAAVGLALLVTSAL